MVQTEGYGEFKEACDSKEASVNRLRPLLQELMQAAVVAGHFPQAIMEYSGLLMLAEG